MESIKSIALNAAERFKQKFKIDTRFVVFDVDFDETASTPELHFTVSSEYLKKRILKECSESNFNFVFTVNVLPSEDISHKPIAICNVSAAPIVAEPTDRSEQTTQFLIGESADILQFGKNDWVRVRLHLDGYIGWVSRNQIAEYSLTDFLHWTKLKNVETHQHSIMLRSAPKDSSEYSRELLLGTSLPLIGKKGNWSALHLPDGNVGWTKSVNLVGKRKKNGKITSREIITTAKNFLGIPYKWGGRSVKGIDCSGFTQTVFRLNGIEIPRDASLQWKCGEEIGMDIEKFVEGDLLFFSSREKAITHVAIYLGDKKFIHASGFVKINSLDSNDTLFVEKYAKQFIGARRLGNVR